RSVRIDELCRDTQLIAGLANAALEKMPDAEGGPDRAQILVLALERERRGPSDDAQARHLAEAIRELLGESVREITLIVVRAHIYEGQHRNRRHSHDHRRILWCGPRSGRRLLSPYVLRRPQLARQ